MLTFSNSSIRTWSMLGSCGAFGIAALELPEQNESTVILTADLTVYSGLERFKQRYPDRLYNMGIAEQNMIGVAAGMAKEGMNVFATTYATFATTRSCDQVRVNMGYMKLGVKLVGLTSGLSVSILGATHVSLEDIAIIRSIPNIVILSPADSTETIKATLAAASYPGPVYLRLSGSMNNPIVYRGDYNFEIGKSIKLLDGTDIAIIATGTMVYQALQAANELSLNGISCSVINMHTIKPLDTAVLNETSVLASKLVVTIEEHSCIGGLGSAVSEFYARRIAKPPQLIIGIPDTFAKASDYSTAIERNGLSVNQIVSRINETYKEVTNDEQQ